MELKNETEHWKRRGMGGEHCATKQYLASCSSFATQPPSTYLFPQHDLKFIFSVVCMLEHLFTHRSV